MRHTRFNNLTKEYEYRLDNPNTSIAQDINAGTQKLGHLEDKEDELGIDLITLFKALTDGIYVNNGSSIIFYPACELRLGYDNHYGKGELCIIKDCGYAGNIKLVSLTNEGKTWALTKEELL